MQLLLPTLFHTGPLPQSLRVSVSGRLRGMYVAIESDFHFSCNKHLADRKKNFQRLFIKLPTSLGCPIGHCNYRKHFQLCFLSDHPAGRPREWATVTTLHFPGPL